MEYYQKARRATLVSLFTNLGLALGKIAVGRWAASQALVADGLHSLADVLSRYHGVSGHALWKPFAGF